MTELASRGPISRDSPPATRASQPSGLSRCNSQLAGDRIAGAVAEAHYGGVPMDIETKVFELQDERWRPTSDAHPVAGPRSGLFLFSLAVALLLGGCVGGRPLLRDGKLKGWAWSRGLIPPPGSRSITIKDCRLPHPRCTSVEARITVRQGNQEEGYPARLTSEGFQAVHMRKIRKMKKEVEIAVKITAVEGQDYCDPYLQGAAWTYSGKLEETGRSQYSVSFTQFKASSRGR